MRGDEGGARLRVAVPLPPLCFGDAVASPLFYWETGEERAGLGRKEPSVTRFRQALGLERRLKRVPGLHGQCRNRSESEAIVVGLVYRSRLAESSVFTLSDGGRGGSLAV